jgi:hypothetical protein
MLRVLPFVCVLFLIQSAQIAKAQECDAAYVDFSSEGEVKIEPTSMEDAENIQCAVDEAIRLGKTKISLQKGEFLLGASISFVGFTGEFSGVSKANTTVKTIPNSWECRNDIDTQEQLFRVANGSVQFATMSVVADDPCIEGTSFGTWKAIDISPIYLFCDKRVSFSSVDRVTLKLNATVNGRYTAIHARNVFFAIKPASILLILMFGMPSVSSPSSPSSKRLPTIETDIPADFLVYSYDSRSSWPVRTSS